MTRCTVRESDDGSHTVVCSSTTRQDAYQGINTPIHSIKTVSTPNKTREITNGKRVQEAFNKADIELKKSNAAWKAAEAKAKETSNTMKTARMIANKTLAAAAGNGLRNGEYNIESTASSERMYESALDADRIAKQAAEKAKIAKNMAQIHYTNAKNALDRSLAQRGVMKQETLLDPHHNGGRSRRNRTLRKQRTTRKQRKRK